MAKYCIIAKGQEIIAEGLEENDIILTTKLYNNKIQEALENAIGIYPNLDINAWTNHEGLILAKITRNQISAYTEILKILGFHILY